nr:MAG TPA: hypothetical protein [Caudoviricetes sp.]
MPKLVIGSSESRYSSKYPSSFESTVASTLLNLKPTV